MFPEEIERGTLRRGLALWPVSDPRLRPDENRRDERLVAKPRQEQQGQSSDDPAVLNASVSVAGR
jgi:hypothetical protein